MPSTQTLVKDKDEPAVNVDLTKGRKEVVSEASLGSVKSLGSKPQMPSTQTLVKDKDEPAVNVDLTKGRKEVVSEASHK